MIKIPSGTEVGKFFYSKDAERDYGIYQVVKRGDGVAHNYVHSADVLEDATDLCSRLNNGSMTIEMLHAQDRQLARDRAFVADMAENRREAEEEQRAGWERQERAREEDLW